MTSDIISGDITVVGLQGRAVSNDTPSDGYVLTWNDGYNQWQPKLPTGMQGLRKVYFTADGYWTCPANVNNIFVIAAGGGSGGWAGIASSTNGGYGYFGQRSIEVIQHLNVIPNTNYEILIGAGGTGGIGNRMYQSGGVPTNIDGTYPTQGFPTQIKDGSNIIFYVIGATGYDAPMYVYRGYTDGTNGIADGAAEGGLGGKVGWQGNGGNGGNGLKAPSVFSPYVAGAGQNAAANSAAGGGGGGACGTIAGAPFDIQGGPGGNGGSGYLYILY